jgi:uncharacterized OB-fold protein
MKPLHSSHEQAFRAFLAQKSLRYAACATCGRALAYTQRICPEHPRAALDWLPACGKAILHTFCTYRIGYADRKPPYVVAIVELQEGPRLSCMLDADPHLRVGMPMRANFDAAGSLTFRPTLQETNHDG